MIDKQTKIDKENPTGFIENDILDKLTDISDYNEALKNLKASKGKTVSRENVLKELGLNQ